MTEYTQIIKDIAFILQTKPELVAMYFFEYYAEEITSKEQLARRTVELIYQNDSVFIEHLSKLIVENSVFETFDPSVIFAAIGAVGNAIGGIVTSKNNAVAASYTHATSINDTTQDLLGYMQEVEGTKQSQSNMNLYIVVVAIIMLGVISSVVLIKKIK